MKIYIFAIDHGFQRLRKMSADFLEKQNFLRNSILSLLDTEEINILAEEYSQEALDLYHDKETLLQSLGSKFEIFHLFCDPSSKERSMLRESKIDESEYRPREEFWMNRLNQRVGLSDCVIFFVRL